MHARQSWSSAPFLSSIFKHTFGALRPNFQQRVIGIHSPGDNTVAPAAWRNGDTEVSYRITNLGQQGKVKDTPGIGFVGLIRLQATSRRDRHRPFSAAAYAVRFIRLRPCFKLILGSRRAFECGLEP